MALTCIPWVPQQFTDDNGKPISGGQLFTYAAGTSTKLATYQDSSGSTAHSNPIILDSGGFPPATIYLQATNYKFVWAPSSDTDPPASPIKTRDNIAATPAVTVDLDISGTAGMTLSATDCVYLSDGSGGRTTGRWYQADADTIEYSTSARCIGFVVSGGAAGDTITVRRMGRMTGFVGLTAGSPYYVSGTAGAITATAPANSRRVGQADTTTSLVIAAEIHIPTTLGYIPLDLSVARELAANVTQNAAANGGILASDTTPVYERVNGATDQAIRIRWAATIVDEVTWSFSYPPDWDGAGTAKVYMRASMSGATNAPTIAVEYFEATGDTDAGGNTAAVTGTTIATYSVTIAAANLGEYPNFASISLTPAAHGTDALNLYAIWVEYTRKAHSF